MKACVLIFIIVLSCVFAYGLIKFVLSRYMSWRRLRSGDNHFLLLDETEIEESGEDGQQQSAMTGSKSFIIRAAESIESWEKVLAVQRKNVYNERNVLN